MAESQIDLAEGELVSDFEFILPWDVIETCCSLKPQGTSCFVSLNKQAKTSNQLFVSKLEDNSIKIRIRVVNIDGEKNKDVETRKDQVEKLDAATEESQINIPAEEVDAVNSHEPATNSSETKQIEAVENIDLPEGNIDASTTEILNKMITEEQSIIEKGDQLNKSNFSEGLSTVIIVKKVSSLTAAQTALEIAGGAIESNSTKESTQLKTNKENLEDDVAKKAPDDPSSFTVVKPRTAEREEKKEEVLNTIGMVQVTCELCFQQYKSYSHLVRHVRKQHRDCTFVRNYLEEIRPLTITPCPICKRNFTAKSSLDAHLKVSHGGQFVRIKNLPPTSKHEAYGSQPRPMVEAKKRNVNENKSATSQPSADVSLSISKVDSESDEDSDSSNELVNGKQRVKCDVCNESFETRQQALKHQDQVHRRQTRNVQKDATSDLFPCKYCDKKLKTKELLLKHCLGTHFKSNNSKKNKQRKLSASSVSDENLEESECDPEFEEDGRKTSAKKQKGRSEQGSSKSTRKCHGRNQSQATGSASSPDTHGMSGFICDLCGMEFNRMTLLVTHARYCRKSAAPK